MGAVTILAFVLAASPNPVVPAPKGDSPTIDLAGSWTITWVNDPANVNSLKWTQSGDKLEGTYVNDAKETCVVSGRVNREKGTVSFSVKGSTPTFQIECEGNIASPEQIEGQYSAYGNTNGAFRMSRAKKK